MDAVDKKLLNQIQSGFPVTKRPFLELGKTLNLSEEEVLDRVNRLKSDGIIRRIGGNFNSAKLGFTSTLCAARVPAEKIDEFAEVVNSYRGVTHNYLRNSNYNLWFTFIAPDMKSVKECLEEISVRTGVKDILNLPAARMYKVKVDLAF